MHRVKQYIKIVRQRVKDKLKLFRRTIRTSLKSPLLAIDFLIFRFAARKCDWKYAKHLMNSIAERSYTYNDHRLLREMSHSALRFLDVESHVLWESKCKELEGSLKSTEWAGEDISKNTLWIIFKESEKQGISIGLALSGYIKAASDRAKYTVLVVDQRLVSIFSRTLKNIKVVAGPVSPKAIQGKGITTADGITLRRVFGSSYKDLKRLYKPLIPDKNIENFYRKKYRDKKLKKPLFGLAWGSFSAIKKEAPLEHWVEFVKSVDAYFIITQYKYDGFESDVKKVISASPDRVIIDDSFNQLVDMDNFAAMLVTLDAYISTSSSDSNLAGSVGIKTFMICDDLFRRVCPVNQYNKIPWFPDSTLYGKSCRDWTEVFKDLKMAISKEFGHSVILNSEKTIQP